MKKVVLASLVLASLALAVHPAAEAQPASVLALTIVGGGGELSSGPFAVEFVSLAVNVAPTPISFEKGKLFVDGAKQVCSAISLVTDCSAATLTCADGTHEVVAGGAGTGSIDGNLVTGGFIRMHCVSH